MMVAEGQDVKVFSDDIGALIWCDWICPHCEEENFLSTYTSNVAGTAETFSIMDVVCEHCSETSMILCKNATRTYKIKL